MGNQCKNIFNDDANLELNIESKDSPRSKFKELDDFKKETKELEIFKRPKIAKKKFDNFIKFEKNKNVNDELIKQDYIEISKLLILNDTDKDIVKLYLK